MGQLNAHCTLTLARFCATYLGSVELYHVCQSPGITQLFHMQQVQLYMPSSVMLKWKLKTILYSTIKSEDSEALYKLVFNFNFNIKELGVWQWQWWWWISIDSPFSRESHHLL